MIDENLREAHETKRWAIRAGNTAAAQACTTRIEIYEQVRAELNQRDQAACDQYVRNHREWAARDRFTSARNGLWADVLRWARSGELPTNWRDLLPGYHARCAAIGGRDLRDDIDGLVLHELATLPPQPWEPYIAGGDWHAALSAWYRDMLALHDRKRQQDQEMRASEPQPFRLPVTPMPDPYNPRIVFDDWADMNARCTLRDADFDAIQVMNHVRRRDRLEAWYRAGLAAGGDDEDWAGWYRNRINSTWDRRQDVIYGRGLITADSELARLDDGDAATLDASPAAAGGWIRIRMHALPDYWRHHAPAS
ncbi:hypothetical protein [Mycobacterium riyadhense]|uniref:hypothetical protein n=1 Tax=Mycobacterium riyadhense TaxID=486698 RepID=UPI00195EB4D5|nr:hypothetical protein [Mycobacterium riyadhense]